MTPLGPTPSGSFSVTARVSIRQWCHRHGVSEPSFNFWRWELAHRGAGPQIVPVKISPSSPISNADFCPAPSSCVFGPAAILADATLVLVEGDVQHPVERVFDGPAPTHGLGQPLGMGSQATDEVADLKRLLAVAGHIGKAQAQRDYAISNYLRSTPVRSRRT